MIKVNAIVVAAGSGKRMGGPIPKQFIKINGICILEHTIAALVNLNRINKIIVVLSKDYLDYITSIQKKYSQINITACLGGKERFHSVQNALKEVNNDCEIVCIHDAVRPFITPELITRSIDGCIQHSNAIPAILIKDSVRIINHKMSKAIERSKLRAIQTPQFFNCSKLLKAYSVEFSESFTDDASVYELAGHDIHLVEGEPANQKITTPEDLEWAKFQMRP